MKLARVASKVLALPAGVLGLPTTPDVTHDSLHVRQTGAPVCLLRTISEDAHPELFFGLQYTITASVPADKVADVCRAFIAGLESTRHCRGQFVAGRKPVCRDDRGGLKIKLSTLKSCGQSMVHGAWFHATENKYGSVQCDTMEDIWN
ncbi:hypothetical protein CTA2_5840 [Colletotrichum tanaceti]|uniref:Uncharacterized protein n=1 Tax=Colletotrichum tanaceti TaxID=1306861 RepID=A0A4U6XB92_9PEZI|nr:hypothetical protein CTA2_5840 [Colletotrichum tanaceti]TKW52312.1 hypothetical protein CTA1_3102 [Colletotrichum tanaceti]